MPNAINKVRTNNLLKLEKENENKVIRRKQKTTSGNVIGTGNGKTAERLVVSRPESVWERLSRVRKSPSSDSTNGGTTTTRSQHNLLQRKSSNHIPLPLRLPITHTCTQAHGHGHGSTHFHGHGNTLGQSRAPHSAGTGTVRKPLSPSTAVNMYGTSRHLTGERKVSTINRKTGTATAGAGDKMSTSPSKAPKQSGSFVMLCSSEQTMQELLTARSICNSKSSSGDSKDSPKSYSAPRELPTWNEFSQDSDYYETAPLISVPTMESLNNIHSVSQRLRNVLEKKNKTMAPDEFDTVKQVVKTDERYREHNMDDAELFKDILRSQLHEILRQELVVKSALSKLNSAQDTSLDTERDGHIKHSIEIQASSTTTSGADSDPQRPKVDVIFKNVPTLEKEIIILKALGEKLEATLKRTNPLSICNDETVEVERLKESGVQATAVHLVLMCTTLSAAQNAQVAAYTQGVRIQRGIVKEFRIVQKTIVELKEQANKHFYLPIGQADSTELKRTSFRRLKEKPDILLQHLRSKSSSVSFNVLEQDPMFFNSLFFHNSNNNTLTNLTDATSEDSNSSYGAVTIPPNDDSTYKNTPPLKMEELKITEPYSLAPVPDNAQPIVETLKETSEMPMNVLEPLTTEAPPKPVAIMPCEKPKKRTRRFIKRHTLFNERAIPSYTNKPINRQELVKTILVGCAQISVFLLMIIAVTFPDPKC